MMKIGIRGERSEDIGTIRNITEAAFKDKVYSNGKEAAIVGALREANALTISLLAVSDDEIVGHIAFSPVTINGTRQGWYGLGPVSVRPDKQGVGIGSALIEEGSSRLREYGAEGCVSLGSPAFYQRFGFAQNRDLWYDEAPPEHFMKLTFNGNTPSGKVLFHEAFSAT